MVNYLEISETIRANIASECETLDSCPILISKYSRNVGDSHLYYVLAKRYSSSFDEDNCYVLWSYNTFTKSLFEGYYMLSYTELMKLYASKLY